MANQVNENLGAATKSLGAGQSEKSENPMVQLAQELLEQMQDHIKDIGQALWSRVKSAVSGKKGTDEQNDAGDAEQFQATPEKSKGNEPKASSGKNAVEENQEAKNDIQYSPVSSGPPPPSAADAWNELEEEPEPPEPTLQEEAEKPHDLGDIDELDKAPGGTMSGPS
jgi:hypothetical protein